MSNTKKLIKNWVLVRSAESKTMQPPIKGGGKYKTQSVTGSD